MTNELIRVLAIRGSILFFGRNAAATLASEQQASVHPSQISIKFTIPWWVDHLPTCSRRNYTTALLVFDVHKQAKGKAWEGILEKKIPLPYPKVCALPLLRLFNGHHYLQRHLNRIGFSDVLTVQRRRTNGPWSHLKISGFDRLHGQCQQSG